MNVTGNQIAKAAVPAVVLTGSGFFGSLVAGAIILIGITGGCLLVSVAAIELIDKCRGRKLRGKPETA